MISWLPSHKIHSHLINSLLLNCSFQRLFPNEFTENKNIILSGNCICPRIACHSRMALSCSQWKILLLCYMKNVVVSRGCCWSPHTEWLFYLLLAAILEYSEYSGPLTMTPTWLTVCDYVAYNLAVPVHVWPYIRPYFCSFDFYLRILCFVLSGGGVSKTAMSVNLPIQAPNSCSWRYGVNMATRLCVGTEGKGICQVSKRLCTPSMLDNFLENFKLS